MGYLVTIPVEELTGRISARGGWGGVSRCGR